MDIFYSIKELSKILKICDRTVQKLIRNGRIRAVNVGSDLKPNWRIYDGELKRFIAENYLKYGKGEK